VPGVLSRDCLNGACCAESRQLLRAALAPDVAFVSVYSRSDGVVDWRACLDPRADHIEVDSSHVGMVVNAAVYRVVADCLTGLRWDATPAQAPLVAA
jgi:triacylglycerol lipase